MATIPRTATTARGTGGFLSDSRPLRINPTAQPADRQDGEYLDYGEVPKPGERPVTPLWERVPGYNGTGGGSGGGFSGTMQAGGGGGGNVTATNRQVQANETVADQLNRLTRGDSAYIQGARNRTNRAAASRGLLSSGMAMGNAEAAAIDAALPIAAQDAAWYGRTAADNMDATNRAAIESANNATQIATTSMSVGGSLQQAAMRNELEREQAAYDRNFRREQNIWDSEELGRQDERRTRLEDWTDSRQIGRREGVDSRADYRREGIDSRSDRRRFELDQAGEDIRRRADARDYAYRSILDGMIQSPEEFDEYMASGIMEFWFGNEGQSAQYFDSVFDEVFGEEP